jgi:hypothetical protein
VGEIAVCFGTYRSTGQRLTIYLPNTRHVAIERLRKIVVAAVGSAHVIDLIPLLSNFGERYGRMRVIQALLAEDRRVPERVTQRYPTEFLQAMARLRHRASLATARRLLNGPQLRKDPTFLAWCAWAMFENES